MAEQAAFKPTGHPSVSAYIMADEAHRVLKFAKAVFHAEILQKIDRADGRIMHAELRIDDSVIMLADSTDEYPALSASLHVYVPDVDASYTRALEVGGTSVQAPDRKGDEDRRGGVRDPAGNVWWISTRVR